jgi:outer membrane protein assembly factor BamE (lipoprotein component of BamABCDE complex)
MNARLVPLLCLAVLLGACSTTPANRIEKNRSAFDQYPADVQEKIQAGKVEVGFTPDMVRFALGEPKHRMTHKTDRGEADIWIYVDSKPAISFGIGIGTGGRHSGGSVGIATSTGGRRYDGEKARVEFSEGKVIAVAWSE